MVTIEDHQNSHGQGSINFRHKRRQLLQVINKNKVGRAIHMAHIRLSLLVNSDAKWMNTGSLCFKQGVSRVLDGILILIIVLVFGFAVGKYYQQTQGSINLLKK